MTSNELVEVICQSYLFKGLLADVKDRLLTLAITRTLADGETLFTRGDPADGLYGIQSGQVRISVVGANGQEVGLALLEPGQVFGEIALLDNEPRTASATAVSVTTLAQIDAAGFDTLLNEEPRLSRHLLKVLSQRIRRSDQLIEELASLGRPARLAKQLLDLARRHGEVIGWGGQVGVRLARVTLTGLVGASPHGVDEELERWREAGWITLERDAVVIYERQALADLAGDIDGIDDLIL